jgi:signal peptidase I
MRERPDLHHKKDAEISLSGTAVIALLSAVHEKGADFRFRASGASMSPTIRNGDIITLSPLNGITPVFGDILAFRHPETGKLIVHRVIDVSSATFLAKGDSSLDPDGSIPIPNILGVVTRVERNGLSLFWPDIRHFPGTARLYFRIQYRFLNLKIRIYSVYMMRRMH